MEQVSLARAAGFTTYPGRGLVAGKSADGKRAILAYFIMGRSLNSRNRIFVREGDGIRTEAFDPSKLTDPSLVIYTAVRILGNKTVCTNGDQTDTICEFLSRGQSPEEALRTRTFEPDPPNFTPRISAVCTFTDGDFSLQMSILKAADGEGAFCARHFWEYESIQPGAGYFIHTYKCDGNPIPAFEGEPERVSLGNTAQETAEVLWKALDADNKVSLWVQTVELATQARHTVIINKNR